MQTVYTPDAVPPLPVFSQAVITGGYVCVSGNIGCTKDFKLVAGGVQAETVCQNSVKPLPIFSHVRCYQRAALENLQIVLAAAGSGLQHIVKANIYMLNMKDEFQLMNEVYAKVSVVPSLYEIICSID